MSCDKNRRPPPVRSLAICLGLLTALPALAETPTPVEQLRQMAHSLRSLDYEGSFIYQNGARVDSLRIVHSGAVPERERLMRLSGPASVAVRHGQTITVEQEGTAPVTFAAGATARLLPLVPTEVAALSNEHYRLQAGDADRVAGYDTRVIDIVASDGFRYSYRLWLDRDHHFPLRVAILDDNQRTVEQLIFVTLSIGNTPLAFDVGAAHTSPASPTASAKSVEGKMRWTVGDLPPGFSLRARQSMPASDSDAEQLVFSDGLANVSAYVEPTPEPIDDDIAFQRGAMNVYIHRDRNWRYTVLGNVPAATVQRIAVSIAALPENDPQN